MTERNTLVDASTHMEFIFHVTPLELAKGFHQLYNVSTATLQQKFNIFRASARTVVLQCPQFVHFHHPPHVGINPRGLIPLKIWQMDVTHVPAIEKLNMSMFLLTPVQVSCMPPLCLVKKPTMLLAIA